MLYGLPMYVTDNLIKSLRDSFDSKQARRIFTGNIMALNNLHFDNEISNFFRHWKMKAIPGENYELACINKLHPGVHFRQKWTHPNNFYSFKEHFLIY